ncbi:MAG: hypothetical protein ACJ72W_22905 [Actinoallomurus sp.]
MQPFIASFGYAAVFLLMTAESACMPVPSELIMLFAGALAAGFAVMPPVRFGVYTLAGCIPWTAALGIVGYAVGRNWQRVADGFHGPSYAIAALVGVAVVIAAVIFVRRRRRAGETAG